MSVFSLGSCFSCMHRLHGSWMPLPSAWRREDCKAERGPRLIPDRTEWLILLIDRLRVHNIGSQQFFWHLAAAVREHQFGLAEIEKALALEGLKRPLGFPGRWNLDTQEVEQLDQVKVRKPRKKQVGAAVEARNFYRSILASGYARKV